MKTITIPLNKNILCGWLLILVLTACSNQYVANPNFPEQGPWLVKKKAPKPAPEPEPVPESAPLSVPLPAPTLAELNNQAATVFKDLGFDSEVNDRGVIVYLPPNIYFNGSAAEISLDARGKIAEIANEVNKEYLQARQIEISGHTDSLGSEEINMALSKRRAEAAAQELVFSRVSESRLQLQWYGESKPRVAEADEQGRPLRQNRALNRRVEFTILNPS